MLVVDIATHGLTTPDGYWKVMIRGNDVNAWSFPNGRNAAKVGKKALDAEFAILCSTIAG